MGYGRCKDDARAKGGSSMGGRRGRGWEGVRGEETMERERSSEGEKEGKFT